MAKMGLTGQTVHGATLASASKFEYKHFLLLQVLWVEGHVENLSKSLPDIDKWISKAKEKLATYKSWNTYCQGFTGLNIEEGSFAVARHYQLEVIKTESEIDPWSLTTPIARRTRTRDRAKGLTSKFSDMLLETPSKSTNIPKILDDDDSGSDDLFETPTPEPKSSFQEKSPISKELENTIYPPTKDEQIVNAALVIFLNTLTIPFSLINNWTLHRKAFKAEFEEASYEARTDGYLSDLQGNAQVIIEVKPVLRSAKLVAIQMQESAQMVAWIKSDDESSNKSKKVYV